MSRGPWKKKEEIINDEISIPQDPTPSLESNDAGLDSLKSSFGSSSDGPKKGRKSKAEQETEKNLQSAIDAICNPEILGDVMCAPFDARLAVTGSQIFLVEKEQRIRLGVHAATVLKAFNLIQDPKWYAVGLLAFEFIKMSITMEIKWRAQQKALKKQEISNQKVDATAKNNQE